MTLGGFCEKFRGLVKVPHFSFFLIREDFAAMHVGIGWIREWAVIKAREFRADGGIPWLRSGHVYRRADFGHIEDFAGGVQWHTDAAMSGRIRFYETPVHSVRRGVEGHPVSHRVTSSGIALAAAMACF